MAEVTVKIEAIAFGGQGIGNVVSSEKKSLVGKKALISNTLPQEIVTAVVFEDNPNYLKATLSSVENNSPVRVLPECPHFYECGGCQLQHIAYSAQLKFKWEMLQDALSFAKIPTEVVSKLEKIVPSKPFEYRRRVSLHIDKLGRIGFHRPLTRDVVDLENCLIVEEKIQECFSEGKFKNFANDVKGKIQKLLVEVEGEEVFVIAKTANPLSTKNQKEVLQALNKYFKSFALEVESKEIVLQGKNYQEERLVYENLELNTFLPLGSFSQINRQINSQIIKDILDFLTDYNRQNISSKSNTTESIDSIPEESNPADCDNKNTSNLCSNLNVPLKKVLDLYAGAGNFSLPLAGLGMDVTAVELERSLVEFGRRNEKNNQLSGKLEFIHQSVESYLKNDLQVFLKGSSRSILKQERYRTRSLQDKINAQTISKINNQKEKVAGRYAKFDLVFADPPRSGLGAVCKMLPDSKLLIYISCHLPSLIRDLPMLLSEGWKVRHIRPYDMFPQTSYLEIVCIFEREDSDQL